IDKNKAGKRKYILTPTVVCVDSGQRFVLNGDEYVYPNDAKKIIVNEFGTDNMREEDDIKQAYKDNVKLDMLEITPDNIKKYADSEDNDSVFGIPEVKRFKWFEACLGKLQESELNSNDKMAVNRYEFLAQTILKYCK
ncbi:MAG: hypothetical protein LBI04_10070, partial [Treponema sp.]|nr:hypothetical protein [Treponema sp.]